MLHKIQGGLDNLLKGAATQCIQVRHIETSTLFMDSNFDRILTLHLDLESILVYRRRSYFCIYFVPQRRSALKHRSLARAATSRFSIGRHACPINYIGIRQGAN